MLLPAFLQSVAQTFPPHTIGKSPHGGRAALQEFAGNVADESNRDFPPPAARDSHLTNLLYITLGSMQAVQLHMSCRS